MPSWSLICYTLSLSSFQNTSRLMMKTKNRLKRKCVLQCVYKRKDKSVRLSQHIHTMRSNNASIVYKRLYSFFIISNHSTLRLQHTHSLGSPHVHSIFFRWTCLTCLPRKFTNMFIIIIIVEAYFHSFFFYFFHFELWHIILFPFLQTT